MRRSRATLSLLAAAVLVLGACAGLAPALGATGQAGATRQSRAAAAAASLPAHYAAPYLQITSGDVGDMAADLSASGDKYYTLAFLIPQSGCTPEWEDNGNPVGAFTSQVNSLQAAGGGVIISFGGESGGELAQTCTSVSSLLNPESGKCLDDTGWSTTPGTQLQIWSCTGGANQSWTLPG